MYYMLFSLAGFAMLGWALLILLPAWRFTRRVAETAAFPLFLCLLYVVGIVAVFSEMGPGIVADFGSADGVVDLLASGPVALVAWIHILAFDHLVVFGTLMLGPVGFLTYWAIRVSRTRTARTAWDQGGTAAAVVGT